MALIQCKECGKEMSDQAVSCPNCGAKNKNNDETATAGLKVICFVIPLIGIIIFAINISTKPKYAKDCLIASLLPTIIALIAIIVIGSATVPTSKGVFANAKSLDSSTSFNTSIL